MKIKEKVLKRVNGHTYNNENARKNMHKAYNRCYVLAKENGKIITIKKSKRGVKGEIKKLQNQSYYDEYRQKMVNRYNGEQAVEIVLDELLDINNKQLWYNTIRNDIIMSRQGEILYYDNYKSKIDNIDIEEMVLKMIREFNETGGLTLIQELENEFVNLRELRYD
jgi:hypothetical protein